MEVSLSILLGSSGQFCIICCVRTWLGASWKLGCPRCFLLSGASIPMVSTRLLVFLTLWSLDSQKEKAEVTVILRLGLHSCHILPMKAW